MLLTMSSFYMFLSNSELGDMAVQKERKVNYADRHWTEKPLDQMRERDWRIFKEDFNISCKGTTTLHLDLCLYMRLL